MENITPKENTSIKIIKQIFQLLLFIGLGLFFVWISFRGLSDEQFQSIKDSILGINNPQSWLFLTFSLLCGAFAHFFRACRSVLLIEPLGYKVRYSMSFYAVMVCYLMNLAFPRLGEVLRCTFLQRYEKVPFQKSLGTIVAERALDVLIWLPLFIIVILFNTSLLSKLIIDKENNLSIGNWIENFSVSFLTNIYLYVAVVAIITVIVVIVKTRKRWMKIPFFMKIKNFVIGIWQGLISIKDVKKPKLFILYTILIWVFYFLGTFLCFFAFDFLAHLGPAPAFTVLILGTLGFMVAQGGIGAYPLIVAGVLVLYNIEYAPALAAGWVGWSVQTVMIIIFGFLSLILASLSNRKASKTA